MMTGVAEIWCMVRFLDPRRAERAPLGLVGGGE